MVTPYLVLVTSTVGRHEFTRRLRHGWPLQRLVSSANFHETGLRFSLACTSRQCNIRVAALGHIVVSVLDFCSRGQWTEAEDARCRLVRRNRHRRACAAGHARKDTSKFLGRILVPWGCHSPGQGLQSLWWASIIVTDRCTCCAKSRLYLATEHTVRQMVFSFCRTGKVSENLEPGPVIVRHLSPTSCLKSSCKSPRC